MARKPTNNKSIAIWLGIFFILALALRIAFNVGVAFDADGPDGGRYLYSGNDPWYHDRSVDHILETGETLTFDESTNYPDGLRNPNPPLFDWLAATDAFALQSFGVEGSTSLALNLSVAMWGALTVFPVFMIGALLWGRSAGLWGAFFIAVSAPHIQRSVFGFADHDATAVFFICLTMAFLLKALSLLRNKEYVKSWKSNPKTGIRAGILENKQALIWSALAGIALAATALTWKGYPYVLGVMAFAFAFQLLVDHAKNRDSTVLSLVYLIPVALSLLVALPFYSALNIGGSATTPHLWVLLGMLVATAVLVPTRELPSILVFPGLVLAGGLGVLVLLFVAPSVGNAVFTGLGYFQTSKLYSTISEAQRTELGFVAANFGFFTFVLSFWYLFKSGRAGFKGSSSNMLMFFWAVVAVSMAFAAGRFVFNAAPVFAILAGVGTAHIMRAIGASETGKAIRNLARQGNPVGAFFKGLTPKTTFGSLAVLAILVMPNVWLGVDAGMSFDYERDNDLDRSKLGAFGTSFELHNNGWLPLMDELASRDTDVTMSERPAFIAWWDYGHWATAIGKHPAVADPFQNHFELSGRFLSSESEEEAILWLTLLINNGSPEAQAVWSNHGVNPANVTGSYDQQYDAVAENVDDAFVTYEDMAEATGKFIGYMGADSRMYPLSASNTGIFYAPVFLGNKNPDDFLSYTYSSNTGLNLDLHQYGIDDDGNSYRLEQPLFLDSTGNEWVVVNGQAYTPGSEPTSGTGQGGSGGIPVQPQFRLTNAFYNTMYARAFGSPDASVPAGIGLSHWRVIHEGIDGSFRTTVLLEYVPGGIPEDERVTLPEPESEPVAE
jgi:asparagine N-glycosylation enzyme membrane subunit Stt3